VTHAGLVPKEHDVANASVQKGIVISTNPANGSLVARGTTVTLIVSTAVSPLAFGTLLMPIIAAPLLRKIVPSFAAARPPRGFC